MAIIRVSSDKMAEVSAMCASLADKYDEDMNKTREILQMLGAMWEDPGMDGYKRELEKSLSEIEKTKNVLTELGTCLRQAEGNMRQADRQIANQLRDILF